SSFDPTTAAGTATCTTSFPVADSGKSVVAKYVPGTDLSGHFAGAPSTSTAATLPTITKGDTTSSLFAVDPTVTSGTPVTYTAGIFPVLSMTGSLASTIAPTGRVVFLDGSTPINCTGAGDNVLAPAAITLLGEADATCTTSFAFGGTYSIGAQYAGDNNL